MIERKNTMIKKINLALSALFGITPVSCVVGCDKDSSKKTEQPTKNISIDLTKYNDTLTINGQNENNTYTQRENIDDWNKGNGNFIHLYDFSKDFKTWDDVVKNYKTISVSLNGVAQVDGFVDKTFSQQHSDKNVLNKQNFNVDMFRVSSYQDFKDLDWPNGIDPAVEWGVDAVVDEAQGEAEILFSYFYKDMNLYAVRYLNAFVSNHQEITYNSTANITFDSDLTIT